MSVKSFDIKWGDKPGLLRHWLYPVGQTVKEGDHLAECEPRGVELRATVTGQIKRLCVRSGTKVEPGTLVAVLQQCPHSAQYGGVCSLCGMEVKEFDKHTFSTVLSTESRDLKITHDAAKQVSLEKRNALMKARKLALILDLDKTILHTIDRRDQAVLQAPLPEDIPHFYHFTLPDNPRVGYFVKFRPHLREFLIEASKQYEIHVYTAGELNYANKIVELIKTEVLKGETEQVVERVFGSRVLTRTHTQQGDIKDLKVIFPHDHSMAIIIDDREDVWRGYEHSLINIGAYEFFQETVPHGPVDAQSAPTHISTSDTPTGGALHSSRKTAELAQFQISYYLDALEDTCLLSSLRVLKKVHDKFFDGLESIHDTKEILGKIRRSVLKGCHILFTHVFPVTSDPWNQPIWKYSERFGARCYNEWTEAITHVVAGEDGTAKVKEALKRERVYLVNRRWLDCSLMHWQRANEHDFPVGSHPVCISEPCIADESEEEEEEIDEEADEEEDSLFDDFNEEDLFPIKESSNQ